DFLDVFAHGRKREARQGRGGTLRPATGLANGIRGRWPEDSLPFLQPPGSFVAPWIWKRLLANSAYAISWHRPGGTDGALRHPSPMRVHFAEWRRRSW